MQAVDIRFLPNIYTVTLRGKVCSCEMEKLWIFSNFFQ